MNIAVYSIQKRVVTLVMTALLLVGGGYAYIKLGRLEDPEYTIKDATILTPYPGASPLEVEQEVSDRIEKAVQQLKQLKRCTSRSQRGLSIVTVTMQDRYGRDKLPQVWDEVRRKVNDVQRELPPGAGPSFVNDDYGDVYGIFFALTGDGHTYAELKRHADFLRRELLLVPDVAKVSFFGDQQETAYVEMSRDRMAQLGITQDQIFQALANKNLVTDSGSMRAGSEYIPLEPTGAFATVEDMGGLVIGDSGEHLIYLRDVATIRHGYADPPRTLLEYDGKPAIGIGISMAPGGNVVVMGEAVKKRLRELEADTPVGMELGIVNFQSDDVTVAVNGFVVNLVEAVIIVIFTLLFAMGLRSGLIIGAVLVLTIAGTLVGLYADGIALERISLGALIIALGMLVDNAIVVTEGMQVRIQTGMNRIAAARDVVAQTMWPLLGATVIAVAAFAPVGLSPDNTGEYCQSLFTVLLISLLFSWVTAITITPLFCDAFLKGPQATGNSGEPAASVDPYAGPVFRSYRGLLRACLRWRWTTVGLMMALLVVAAWSFRFIDKSFFPPSTRAQFIVNLFLPYGTAIEETQRTAEEVAREVTSMEGVTHTAAFIGAGGLRFMLGYRPEQTDSSYAQLLVNVERYESIDAMKLQAEQYLAERYPNVFASVEKFELGPAASGKIRARFSGPDAAVLRDLAERATEIYYRDGGAVGIRTDWRERSKVIRPQVLETQAREVGLSRTDIARALEQAYTGQRVGVFREGDELLPILARAPEEERARGADALDELFVYSPLLRRSVPIRQVVSGFDVDWEDPLVMRRNRMRTIEARCDPEKGPASVLFDRVRPQVEAIVLPEGYRLEWGGEYEDSGNAQSGIASNVPVPLLLMVLIVVFLFNSLRQPGIIWLCVPLSIIGVVAGLLATGQSLGFMAILGILSLSGMVIKNAIVLIDEINVETRDGKAPYPAVLDSAVSRLRPVTMAALTTVMGMIPLFPDPFFASMAVTIAFGLSFATVLTLLVVPVLYAIFYRISPS